MLLCIGGVCVPYTAVVPLLVLALKWVATKLARMGLLPKAAADLLQVSVEGSGKTEEESPVMEAKGPSVVRALESEDDFLALLKDQRQTIVGKFTADWCKPCHKIQPFFERLSSRYSEDAKFFTIDVDEFDGIAAKYKVAMMPTFVIVKGDLVLGSYSGSSEHELQRFLEEQLGSTNK